MDSLYVISTGVVEIDTGRGYRHLATGDAFGMGIDGDVAEDRPEALAMTRVNLLLIRHDNLLDLVGRYPTLRSHFHLSRGVRENAAERPAS